jgi:hypothetical protein
MKKTQRIIYIRPAILDAINDILNKAVNDPDNSDENGINWNYVDADLWIECGLTGIDTDILRDQNVLDKFISAHRRTVLRRLYPNHIII